jgi:hypothetical protein
VLLAPAAWVVMGGVGYFLASRSCESGGGIPGVQMSNPSLAQGALALVLLAVAVTGLVLAVGTLREVHRHRVAADREDMPRATRVRFLAFGGVLVSSLFAVGIILFALPTLMVSACTQARL